MWIGWKISRQTGCVRKLQSTRGVQKVRRLAQLSTRYAHHILSLFDIDTCKWNALGPTFLQSSDPVVEELLFMVFQPAIYRADNVLVVRKFCLFIISFSLGKKQKSLSTRTTHLITGQLKHWLSSKIPALNYSVTHCIRHPCSYCTQMAVWNTGNNYSSTTVSERWRNAGPSALQLQVTMLTSDKIWCAYLVFNCVSLRTFWTPLVTRYPAVQA